MSHKKSQIFYPTFMQVLNFILKNTATAVSPFKVSESGTVCRLSCEFQTLLLKHSAKD